MTFTGDVPSTSSNSPLFSIAVKLRSFEINPSSEEDTEPVVIDPDTVDPVVEPVDPVDPEVEPEKPIIPDTGEIDDNQEPEIVTETEIITVTRSVPNKNTIGEKSKNQKRKE